MTIKNTKRRTKELIRRKFELIIVNFRNNKFPKSTTFTKTEIQKAQMTLSIIIMNKSVPLHNIQTAENQRQRENQKKPREMIHYVEEPDKLYSQHLRNHLRNKKC